MYICIYIPGIYLGCRLGMPGTGMKASLPRIQICEHHILSRPLPTASEFVCASTPTAPDERGNASSTRPPGWSNRKNPLVYVVE